MRSIAFRATWRMPPPCWGPGPGRRRGASPFPWRCRRFPPARLALPPGFHTMTTKIWSLFQYPPKPELAAAASLPLLLLTVGLLRAQHTILGRRGYSVVGGKSADPRLIKLGWLVWPAMAF